MTKCPECNHDILENLGYHEKCHNCVRTDIMNMADEEIADELTRKIYIHKEGWELYEAIRRILLRKSGE